MTDVALTEALRNLERAIDNRFTSLETRVGPMPNPVPQPAPTPQQPVEPPVQQPPQAAPKPGQFFPVFYSGPFPGFDTLAGPPHNYPKGATVAIKGPRGGMFWGVVNPASSTTDMPDGFSPMNGKVGE